MTDSNENKKPGCPGCDYTLAFLLLRGWLAVRAILGGLEKFGTYQSIQKPLIDPATGQADPSGVLVNVDVKYYSLTNYSGIPASLKDRFANEPVLPKVALSGFDHLLGPVLIITGLMLLLGLGTRLSLFVQGLVYIALTAGLVLINQPDGIAYLGIHVGLVAFALALAKYNKLALLKKW
jgi:thiosulfate dehydrogenase [quinone] large subunit